jgi:hypothetical protein
MITPFVRNRLIIVAVSSTVIGAGAYAVTGDATYTVIALTSVVGFWSLVALMHWSQVSASPTPSFILAGVLTAAGLGLAIIQWTHPNPGRLIWPACLGIALAAVFQLWTGLKRRRAKPSL